MTAILSQIEPTPVNLNATLDLRPGSESSREFHLELLERILNNPLLPTPPTLALQIVERSRNADCDVTELGEMLALDPGLCGRLLKTLNSTMYGLSKPVISLTRAVTMLGLKPLRGLVLGLTMSTMYRRMEADDGLRAFWRDSVSGAIMTRGLARRLGYPAPDEDLVASLLRDLGMLLLRQSFPNIYQPIWSRQGGVPHSKQCAWEEKHLGIHHAELGAELLQRWRLPDEFVEPIRYHHHPERMPRSAQEFSVRAQLLEFTSRLARLDEHTDEPAYYQQIVHAAREKYGLERTALEQFLTDVRPGIDEFAAILNLDIGECPDFAEILLFDSDELIKQSLASAERAQLQVAQQESVATSDLIATKVTHANQDLAPPRFDVSESDTCEEFYVKLTKAGGRVQQYEIQDLIGYGAMGLVIKAHDLALDRAVALKFLVPSMLRSSKAHKRFALEARFAAAVRHDHVVTVFAVSELNGLPFLVMEYVKGKSLQDWMDDGTLFAVKDIARIGQQAALGLAAAHELRMIHRDIKPANLLLEQPGQRVRLTDFGLARAMDVDYQLSQPGILVGTPLYMSPEQVDGKTLTPATDLFSLGSVLYELCTGQHPFAGESFSGLLHAVAEKTPTPIEQLNPTIPPAFADVISRMHAKDAATRLGPAAAVAATLAKFASV